MSAIVLVVPGRVDRLSVLAYEREMAAALRRRGWSVVVRELDESFPQPTTAARIDAARVLAAIPDASAVLIDGRALGAMPEEAWRESGRLRIVGLVHHPLAAESGLEPHLARRFEESERRALAAVHLVIATSQATATALHDYGIAANRIAVVEPGTDPAPLARGSQGAVRNLLCVASVVRRKGHETLFRALAEVPRSDWVLTCVGSLTHSPGTVQRLCAQIEADGLDDHVRLVGHADARTLAEYYNCADLFVLPSHHEGFGMAVAEALAHGLPVVGTPTGAIPELVGRDAGMLVPPGDVEALTAVLWRLLDDDGLRARLRAGARRVRERLPTWGHQSEMMAGVLERACADRGRVEA